MARVAASRVTGSNERPQHSEAMTLDSSSGVFAYAGFR